jgi:hypothetical protein
MERMIFIKWELQKNKDISFLYVRQKIWLVENMIFLQGRG